MMYFQEADKLFPVAADHLKELKSLQWLDLATLAPTKHAYAHNSHNALDLAVKSVPQHAFKPTKVAQIKGSFTLFQNLPQEIQNKIWLMKSLNHPRVITIAEVAGSVYTVTGARRPRFFKTCKAVVGAMVSVYKPLFAIHGSNKAVYVNADIDVVHLHSNMSLGYYAPKLGFQAALRHGAEFKLIRHLCLDAAGFERDFAKVANIIRALPNLETVRIEENTTDYGRNQDFFLNLQFVDQYLTHPHRVDAPRLDMVIKVKCAEGMLSGPAAIRAIFQEVTNLHHQARLLTILSRVETMMRKEKGFPASVIGQFNYLAGHTTGGT
ncbi:hypothetical protein CJF32_00009157 [Rutstroemia sp. NJR-2017a WRK4]|nr:hypothetical protein CJF32_00009157 [Rutstroemia sp. NJR-2017a WRK4]